MVGRLRQYDIDAVLLQECDQALEAIDHRRLHLQAPRTIGGR
jgi:hypothetical protein